MSRHREIRNMDYTDDYDGYNDVYGHSIDDDYYISPSSRQFMYNRENSRESAKIGEFMQHEADIQEEDESEFGLSDVEKAKLESCIDELKSTLGAITIPRNELIHLIRTQKYNVEKVLNIILDGAKPERKEKDVAKVFNIPKLNGFKPPKTDSPFKIPQITNFKSSKINSSSSKSNNFVIPKLGQKNTSNNNNGDQKEFTSLSELVSSHLTLENALNINSLTKSVAELQMNNVQTTKSLSSISYKKENGDIVNDFHIDLTKALKTTQTMPNLRQNVVRKPVEESFTIPFIDCETNNFKPKSQLPCKFDVKHILKRNFKEQKKHRSAFSVVLCKNYKLKTRKSVIHENYFIDYCKYFNFNEPSPDDVVLKYLKK